jgi:hypothetical protein
MSIHDKCWRAFFEQHGGLQVVLKKLRANGRLELNGSILAKCGSRLSYSGVGRFSSRGPIRGTSMMANVHALKHFLPQYLMPNEGIYVSVRDRRKSGRGITVIFALLEREEIEAVKRVHRPREWRVAPEPYNVLKDFENSLRRFIQSSLEKIVGEKWWKARVPVDVQQRCRERKEKREKAYPWMEKKEYPLIFYADFLDYVKIITKKDNWRQIFRRCFMNEAWIKTKLMELNPIRTDIAHGRELEPEDIQKLSMYAKEILRCIKKCEEALLM